MVQVFDMSSDGLLQEITADAEAKTLEIQKLIPAAAKADSLVARVAELEAELAQAMQGMSQA
jgi:hypothetical protein